MAKSKIMKGLRLLLEVNRYFFQYSLITYLILLLIETVWEKRVSYHLNLNNLLIAVIISGIITVLSQEKSEREEKKVEKITKKDYIPISILGVMGALIVYYKTASIGNLSIPISIISGLLIILLSIIMLRE